VRTRELERARDWYAALLGRPPDLEPADGVHEWRLAPGAWLQLVAGDPSAPGTGQLLRLGVGEIEAARAQLAAAGARIGEVTTIAGVVAFCDAADPFGNALSLYEDLTANPSSRRRAGRARPRRATRR
jgi:catechol 2,3-dioxygenase-like lactoylglutathione lyase family enzyme